MSRTPEKQPLLVQAKSSTNGSSKPSYQTISYETTPQQSDTCALHLDTLDQKPSTNGYKSIYPRLTNDKGGGGGGGSSPPTPSAFPTENITYSWHNINVFTSSRESRRSRVVNCVKSLVSKNSEYSRVGHRKHILNDVTGVAYPGELIALMGSSGAGKTTLLNSLTFRNSQDLLVSGQRAINGIPVTSNTLASLSAYVQQDDLFVGTLTVREHLVFQALVRMDRHLSYEQRMARVEEVIEELTLTNCQNTIIGVPGKIKGISGGEMKRLSFASEVLTNPPLLFCDEPTSGLDSYMAQNVVSVLKSLANKGKTLICTIHQPSSEVYAMFDKILLMAEGRVAFLGSLDQATDFFRTACFRTGCPSSVPVQSCRSGVTDDGLTSGEQALTMDILSESMLCQNLGAGCPSHYNPADFFIQLLAVVPNSEESCRNMIELVCDTFATSEIGTKLALEAEPKYGDPKSKSMFVGAWGDSLYPRALSPYKASWYSQFKAVLWRSWISVWKEPVLIKVRMLQTFMVALMVGIIYFGQENDQDGVMNINGALFICITNMTFQNVFAVISVFCAELPVFLREHLNGMYRTDVYFLCKTLAEVPIFLAIPVLFTAVMYYMVGLNPAPSKFVQAGIIITLVSNVATSFGYLISCVSSSVSVALSIGPPVVIPFLLFGGFFLNAGSVPPYFEWLSNLSWFKYGNEALLINQWGDVTDIKCTRTNTTCPKDGHIILETYNFSENDYMMDYLCLIGLIVGFRTFAFLSLLYRTSGKKH